MNLKENLIRAFIDNGSHDIVLIEIIRDKFRINGLYSPPASELGETDNRKIISKGINLNTQQNDSDKIVASLQNCLTEFDKIYLFKKRKLNSIYTICLFAIAITFLLIVTGLVITFYFEKDVKLITGSSTILTSFIGGTAFVFFDKVNKNLKQIEDEIIKSNKLIMFFKMIDLIPNIEVRDKSFSDMIKQILNNHL